MRKNSTKLFIAFICIWLGLSLNVFGAEPEWKRGVLLHQVVVRGDYFNDQYCFSIKNIGSPMYRERSPSPNHGVFIVLGEHRNVWAGAVSNAAEYTEAIEAAHVEDGTILEEKIISFNEKPATLFATKKNDVSEIKVIQIRNDRIYEILLTSTPQDIERDKKWLGKFLKAYKILEGCR